MATIETPGPPLTEAEVSALEQRLDLRLPATFRMFLLRFNGGTPSPNVIDVASYAGSPTDAQVVFGIGRASESSNLDWNFQVFGRRLGTTHLPIACDSGGNVFSLSLRDTDLGMVYYFDLDAVYGDTATPPPEYLVAANFDDFLARMRDF